MSCDEVRGFPEALLAAYDPTVPVPSRLNLAGPSADMSHWLAGWAEDADQVRRTIMIRRRADGTKIMTVATLASYGAGTETSLAVESVTVPWRRGGAVRSGVHPKATIPAPSTTAPQTKSPTEPPPREPAGPDRLGPAEDRARPSSGQSGLES
jgi:hypothetical protein